MATKKETMRHLLKMASWAEAACALRCCKATVVKMERAHIDAERLELMTKAEVFWFSSLIAGQSAAKIGLSSIATAPVTSSRGYRKRRSRCRGRTISIVPRAASASTSIRGAVRRSSTMPGRTVPSRE